MNITVIGAGYVGCVTTACFADLGHIVTAVDTDLNKVMAIKNGKSPIMETDLDEYIKKGVNQGKIFATDDINSVLLDTDFAIVCVSTPSKIDGSVNTNYIKKVFESINLALKRRKSTFIVIVRSTIFANLLRDVVAKTYTGKKDRLKLVLNPEFMRETTAIYDFFNPPYIILGGDDHKDMNHVMELYSKIDCTKYMVELETASLLKYSCNSFHALKTTFANEIGTIAEKIGADPLKVMKLLTEDKLLNISPAYLRPGFAYGGSCLPKDTRALVTQAKEVGESVPLLNAVLNSNANRIEQAVELIKKDGESRKIVLVGLSFKLGSNDLRESPYLLLAKRLVESGFSVSIYDPDVDMDTQLGSNLEFIELHMSTIDDIFENIMDVTGVVLCKNLLSPNQLSNLLNLRIHVYDIEYIAKRMDFAPDRLHFLAELCTTK